MFYDLKAHANRRVLLSAVLLSCGLGLGLGATYLGAGLHHSDRTQAVAAAASNEVLRYQIADQSAGVETETRDERPLFPALNLRGAQGGDARQLAEPALAKRDLDCLTQAVYFEARGESPRGQQAVAQVVLNRVKSPHYPKTVCAVVYQGAAARRGCQFSFACDGSMHRTREGAAWKNARRVATRALSGVALSEIGGATHFHTTGVSPAWGPRMLRVAQVGLHVFYKPGAPRREAPAAIEAERAVFVSLPADLAVAPEPLHIVSSLDEVATADATAKPAAAPLAAEVKAVSAVATERKPSEARTISAIEPSKDSQAS